MKRPILFSVLLVALYAGALAWAGGGVSGTNPTESGASLTPVSVTASSVISAAGFDGGFLYTTGVAPCFDCDGSGRQVLIGGRSASYAGIWFGQTLASATQDNPTFMGDNNDTFVNAPNVNSNGSIYFRLGTATKGTITSIGFNTVNAKSQTFGSWSSNTVGVLATGTSFLGCFTPTTAVGFRNITASWAVAGVSGTVGVVVRIRNITDSSTLCTCTLGPCTTAANTPLSCDCNSIATAGKKYCIQYDPTAVTGTDCATDPSGTFATVEMAQ